MRSRPGRTGFWLEGRLPQALACFERVSARCGGDVRVGREVVGYSPLIWTQHLIGMALAMLGRFDECWSYAERAIRLAREHDARENLGWALGSVAFAAYLARGTTGIPVTDLRQACAESVEIAQAGGGRFSQIIASYCLAVAHFLNGDYGVSDEVFSEALARARGAGTALEWQSYSLAVFADACLARGDAEAAIAKAREGAEFADANGIWFQAALCRAALADALVCAKAPEQEISSVIAEARELVRKSGGNSLLPRLREVEARVAGRNDRALLRAGLREAEAMYRAAGAADPARRLAEELGC